MIMREEIIVTNKLKPRYRKKQNYLDLIQVTPKIILNYIRLSINLFVTLMIIYYIYKFFKILEEDLKKHIIIQEHGIINKIFDCSHEYNVNKCHDDDKGHLLPAMQTLCNNWKKCMQQDISNIIKSKESAIIMAEVLNNFFERLTNRTLICSGLLFIGGIVLTNIMLSFSNTTERRL